MSTRRLTRFAFLFIVILLLPIARDSQPGPRRPDAVSRRFGGRRRGRSLRTGDRRPDVEDSRPDHHCGKQARRRRQHFGAIHDRVACERHAGLGQHHGADRDQSVRLFQPALVDRPVHADHQGRSGAAGPRRPSQCSGEQPRRVCRLGQSQSRQAQLFVLHRRHAVALSRLPAQREVRPRSHPRSLPRLRLAGDRPDRRPLAVRIRPGQQFGAPGRRRQAQGLRHHQRRALARHEGRADLRRTGPIPNSPRVCGSACWSRPAPRPTSWPA